MSRDQGLGVRPRDIRLLRWLTGLMFLMFAMTTDAVGVIIPRIIQTFGLSMACAGAFHYATMAGVGLAGVGLGFLADRLGHARAIVLGLALFALTSFLIATARSFALLLVLLFASGAAIAMFKTGALALIGDLSRSTREHTAAMNAVEGFFAVGAILGPLIVGGLLEIGASWRWLYVLAALLCVGLAVVSLFARFPTPAAPSRGRIGLTDVLTVARDPHALTFGLAIMLYVGVETAVYVWLPTLMTGDVVLTGHAAAYALSTFFALRAAGRFLGAWLLTRLDWTWVLAISAVAVLACFCGALAGGIRAAAVALPLSGLFMSVIYPTLNSKAISGFPKARHGAAAGLILFLTCVSAVASPLAMGLLSDAFGGPRPGFILAAVLASVLAAMTIGNLIFDPSRALLARRDAADD
jgi:fucose permease